MPQQKSPSGEQQETFMRVREIARDLASSRGHAVRLVRAVRRQMALSSIPVISDDAFALAKRLRVASTVRS